MGFSVERTILKDQKKGQKPALTSPYNHSVNFNGLKAYAWLLLSYD